MTLRRAIGGDASWSGWSALEVGDVGHGPETWPPCSGGHEPLSRYAGYFGGQGLAGTVARAGEGWLRGTGSWRRTAVRLELHAAVPATEEESWCEAVETPYISPTGLIDACGTDGLEFELDGPGTYRVRVLLRREDGCDRWCLRFWRTSGPVEPPRWLIRSAPAVGHVPADWMKVLPARVRRLYWTAEAEAACTDAPISPERVAAQYESRYRPFRKEWEEGWLDADLWTVHEPLPTGHADLDRENRRTWRAAAARIAKKKRKWRELSERLGVPLPATLRDSFTLLVAAGLLYEDTEGYRVAPVPPPVEDVLDLAPKQRAKYVKRRRRAGHVNVAEDIYALVAWSPGHTITGTAAEFADRLLISVEDFRSALPCTQEEITVTGPEDPITLTIRSRRNDEEYAHDGNADAADDHDPLDAELFRAWDAQLSRHEWPADDMALPPVPDWLEEEDPDPEAGLEDRLAEAVDFFGHQDAEERWETPSREYPEARTAEFGPAGPPRAGLFRCDGRVMAWRGGEPQILARTPRCRLVPESSCLRDGPDVALETPYGTVLAAFDKECFEDWQEVRLVQHDGTIRSFGDGIQTLQRSRDGRTLAFSTRDDTVHLVDLADGSVQTMPPLERARRLKVIGIFAGQVYVNRSSNTGPPYPRSWRWRPGHAPEPLDAPLQWIDPITGTALAARKDGRLLITPDGTTRHLRIDPSAKLAPGAHLLYTSRRDPHALTFFDVHDLGRNPRITWLPPASDTDYFGGPAMVWEDPHHLLIPGGDDSSDPRPAHRLNVQTGQLTPLPIYGRGEDIPLFIQPLL